MTPSPKLLVHAVIGSMAVTIGLWMLLGDLSLPVTVVIVVLLTVIFGKTCPTPSHVWACSTLLIGLESLAWPFLMLKDIQALGSELPLEDMQRIFTAVLFGLFSGVFWLTFAYGIYRRIQQKNALPQPSTPGSSSLSKAKKKKRRTV